MTPRFNLLGPVEGTLGAETLSLGGAKQKTVLAILLLANGRSVSVDHLIESVWGDEPVPGALATLRVFVSNLRRSVAPDADAAHGIRFDGHGYACKFEYELDAFEYEELCRRAAIALPAQAPSAWRSALGLFRGEALGGLESTEPVRREQVRLTESRLAAIDSLFRAELASGCHREIVAELLAAVDEHPLREELRSSLMLALYRSGRQVEALRTYQQFRTQMIGELGIEPSPEMRRLEQLVLDQAPELELHKVTETPKAPSTIDLRSATVDDARLELEDGRTVVLARRVTVIGRDDTADVIIDDRRVSRQHAIIRARHGRYEIVDDASTNGTEVNGHPVDQHELQHDDSISLGGFTVRFLR